MKINIDIDKTQLSSIVKSLNGVEESMKTGLTRAMLHVEGKVKERFGSQGNVKVRTGNLRRSIKSGRRNMVGWVGTDVIYAPAHEHGATIRPKRGQWLRFKIGSQWKTVKQVVIPPRPFLAPTLKEQSNRVVDIIWRQIVEDFTK